MTLSAAPVRGTRDFLPEEMRLRDAMQAIIVDTYTSCGYQRIHTPILEDMERLDKSDGGENLNMLFKILKRGQKLDLSKQELTEKDLADLGLRYDLTMPLSRYFANNRNELRVPFKVIQIGQVFRAERPQKGRLREFYQCDIDIIGDSTKEAEMDLIHTTATALQKLGFSDFTIRINDRQILFDLIEGAGFAKDDVLSVCITFDKLDKIGAEGVVEELKEKGFPQDAIANFGKLLEGDELAGLEAVKAHCSRPEVAENLQAIIDGAAALSDGSYKIVYDKSLVRGMGYYTGTIFEIASPHFSGSIAGGGRYDKMVGRFLGEDIPAVGFSIGFERISEIFLSGAMKPGFSPGGQRMALLYNEEDSFVEVLKEADALRAGGLIVSPQKKAKKLGKQFAALQKDGFSGCYFFGEEEPKLFTEE